MQFLKILTPVLVATIVAASVPSTALAQGANDSVLTEERIRHVEVHSGTAIASFKTQCQKDLIRLGIAE